MNATTGSAAPVEQGQGKGEVWLFWSCFIALIATAFGFIIRSLIIDQWAAEYDLTETEKGQILGVGLWPFALSIVLFSLVIDKIGYGRAMIFAFICHISSAIITITAKGYGALWVGTFIGALGNGTVEAVINPVVATMFSRNKTKWLNILHAGWPGGLVLGGILTLMLGQNVDWRVKIGLIFIPTIAYGIMMFGRKFPVHERVAAGISYKAMLREVGIVGALIITTLMVIEVSKVLPVYFTAFENDTNRTIFVVVVIAILVAAYGAYVKSLGRPLFIFLMLVMVPLATTELGTDTWITDLLRPVLAGNAGWVLVYTSFIMMVLRFSAGPIVHRISPLGLLVLSSAVAAVGLFALSKAVGIGIFLAATLYGFGKSFFWPTMLGVVAERFPRGGALTLNTIAGVGMLSVGIVGAPFLGFIQDRSVAESVQQKLPTVYERVLGEPKVSVFGTHQAVDAAKVAQLPAAEAETVNQIVGEGKKATLATVAIFPIIMLICYLALLFYFRSQGGYRAVEITEAAREDEEKFTGGVQAPVR